MCGVHYPSDVEAGRTVAAAAIARLHADPDFQREFAAARAAIARRRLDDAREIAKVSAWMAAA